MTGMPGPPTGFSAPMPTRLLPVLLIVCLAAAACGSSDSSPAAEGAGIPDVDVIDVRTGDTVSLQSLAPSDTPLLFWFWAPH